MLSLATFVINFSSSHALASTSETSLGVFHTVQGGQVHLFSDGLQKYDYNEILNSPAYHALQIGQTLVDDFIIRFPEREQKFLYVVTLTRTQDINKPAVASRKFLVLKETPIGGIIYRTPKGKIGYYAGDIVKSPIYQELAPGKKLFETFCLNRQQCNIIVEITKPIVSTEKPMIRAIHQKTEP